eukprot:jgi/Picre1/35079/NNA_002543.t1
MRRQVAAWLGSGKFQACWSIGSRCASSASITLPEIDYTPPVYSGPSKEEVLRLREKYLNPAIFYHFKDPVMITDGHMQYLFDEKGRRYLDFLLALSLCLWVTVTHE